MAKEQVSCGEHGQAEATVVCPHLVETLEDNHARGFHWVIDDEGTIQAFCETCWIASEEEWEKLKEAGCRILCVNCLDSAAAINGVVRETA